MVRWSTLILGLIACEDTDTKVENTEGAVVTDSDGDGFATDVDCDDSDALINPDAAEVCDGVDNDCNDEVDEGVTNVFYADSDQDGFGNPDISTEACDLPDGFVNTGTDCDDTNPDSYPSAPELCDGFDNDCDTEIDEELAETYYLDADGDGFGDINQPVQSCDLTVGLSILPDDCNDQDSVINPLATEECDEVDNNCDGQIDEGVLLTFYLDQDEDGYGDDNTVATACEAPAGYVVVGGDCNDIDNFTNPQAVEYCDDSDNNCDGVVDEAGSVGSLTHYPDADGDGFGDSNSPSESCEVPAGATLMGDDCDDNDATANPGMVELCDGVDNNCDGTADENSAVDALTYYADADGDGYGDATQSIVSCPILSSGSVSTTPAGYAEDGTDCDDSAVDADNDGVIDGTVRSPGNAELCTDTIDEDCDGDTTANAVDQSSYLIDSDGDGYGAGQLDPQGNLAFLQQSCSPVFGYVSYTAGDSLDCNDLDDWVHPEDDALHVDSSGQPIDHEELCNGKVDLCENDVNGDLTPPADEIDDDGDGYVDCTLESSFAYNADGTVNAWENSQQTIYGGSDCDDADSELYPNAVELCNGAFENCLSAGYGVAAAPSEELDDDGDGYVDCVLDVDLLFWEDSTASIVGGSDCDDGNAATHPGATEQCDGALNDCSALALPGNEVDDDGDGYVECTIVSSGWTGGAINGGDDCDDLDSATFLGATESCADIDQNCDGDIDNDLDGDGHSDSTCGGSDCDDTDPTLVDDCSYSCQSILDAFPSSSSGAYTIYPDSNLNPIDVYCEMTGTEGWTLLFSAPASNTTYGSAWDYWYQAGGDTTLTDPSLTGKSAAYDYLDISELRLTATYGTSEIIAPLNNTYTGLPVLVGAEITSCAALNGVARHQFTAVSRIGSYFVDDYIALVACDNDGESLEADTHYDAAVFTTNLNHGDYNYSQGDIGSEFRVGGGQDSTSDSNNILRIWAR